jgi:hypothetical protein
MTSTFEAVSQLAIVVNFTVKYDPYRLIFIAQRLMAAHQIDNGKPAKSKRNSDLWLMEIGGDTTEPMTVIIRTSVPNCVGHRTQNVSINGSARIRPNSARYATHC